MNTISKKNQLPLIYKDTVSSKSVNIDPENVSFEIKDTSSSGLIQNHMDEEFTAQPVSNSSPVQKYMANGFKILAGSCMLHGMVSPAAYAAYMGQGVDPSVGKQAMSTTVSPALANAIIESTDLKTAPSVIAETAEYNPLAAFTEFKSISDPEADLWRETPVRLLGYANEVGESF